MQSVYSTGLADWGSTKVDMSLLFFYENDFGINNPQRLMPLKQTKPNWHKECKIYAWLGEKGHPLRNYASD